MNQLSRRIDRVAESILENERLTADLDDAAAKVLLDWGVACVERIARSTAGLDDIQAEEVMYPRLRAVRRLMRQVNRWVANWGGMDAESSAALLSQIIEQAAVIYGEDFTRPSSSWQAAFVRLHFEFANGPKQLIESLRELLERSSDIPQDQYGGK